MNFFKQLFTSEPAKVKQLNDRIWLTEEAKFKGVLQEAANRVGEGSSAVMLIGYFEDTVEHLQQAFETFQSNTPLAIFLASDLSAESRAMKALSEEAAIDLIAAERHPLATEADHLTSFAEALPCKARMAHHLSLEDPVLDLFAGDGVKELLANFGMEDGENIESQMVSRRIRKALEMVEQAHPGNLYARNAKEWFEKNPRS